MIAAILDFFFCIERWRNKMAKNHPPVFLMHNMSLDTFYSISNNNFVLYSKSVLIVVNALQYRGGCNNVIKVVQFIE